MTLASRHAGGVGWCRQVGAAPAQTDPPPAPRYKLDALRTLSQHHDDVLAASAARVRTRHGSFPGVVNHHHRRGVP